VARLALLAVALVALWSAALAQAAFPGANGRIAFDRVTGAETQQVVTKRNAARGWRARAAGPRGADAGFSDQIWTMNPDGSAGLNVSGSARPDSEAAWSADGTQLAFVADGTSSSIWKMAAGGSGQVNLTNDPDSNDFAPAWSPDGTQIAYAHDDVATSTLQIWAMNSGGTSKHQLVPKPGNASDDHPVWSPDGTKIAFDRVAGGQSQIYVANADGSGSPVNVSNNGDQDTEPNWSPDGSRLVFAKIPPGAFGDSQIWVMNANGSGAHALTTPNTEPDVPGAHFDDAPAFSPDGTLVTYEREGGTLAPVPFQFAVWIIGADASNPHQVSFPDDNAADGLPDWQPAGAPVSAATLPVCSPGPVTVRVSDASGFKSGLNLHYRVDGGVEQVLPVDAAGNAALGASNGTHSVEFWGGDAAGYQEAAHHSGRVTFDTATGCAAAVKLAGVRRACVSKAFKVRVRITSGLKLKSVRVFLGRKRVMSTTRSSFTLKINLKKLGRRTRLRVVATNTSGKATTVGRTVVRCLAAKPRRRSMPRFTG
jgi:Tol biopolymer transport system component